MLFRTVPARIRARVSARPTRSRTLSSRAASVLSELDFGVPLGTEHEVPGVYDGAWGGAGPLLESVCPTTGETLARVRSAAPEELQRAIARAREAFEVVRFVPAPRRGEVVRQIREALALKRDALGALVSLEMGKIRTEGVGEVQEFVDICDYAVGLSRMMNGRVVSSERPGHTILEVPNPLGVVGVISAFNFPIAVYGWNVALSLAAGNATLWKPAPTTPLCAIATTRIIARVLERNDLPGAVAGLVTGGGDVGGALVESEDVDLVSFTGSEAVGRKVGKVVQGRLGKVLLELGGNNACIILPSANLALALPSLFFSAIGTAGQRCTTTRRLLLHHAIAPTVLQRLQALYTHLRPGDPLLPDTVLGPLHSRAAVSGFTHAIHALRASGASILTGGETCATASLPGHFVRPAIARVDPRVQGEEVWRAETFAPVLHVAEFGEEEEAVRMNNAVGQGLASALWTGEVGSVGRWIGPGGSDCGIVNVNVGTSGAEIGAAFGGNKNTGWGRESGGDAWKQYVRWSACTLNFSDAAPLAQGVDFNFGK